MATCGHCKATNVDVAHVRTCAQMPITKPTDSQLNYIRVLCEQRDLLVTDVVCGLIDRRSASALIDDLKSRPIQHRETPSVPTGRYAIEIDNVWKFYKVETPTKGQYVGRSFVKVQASSDYFLVGRSETTRVLTEIAKAPQTASREYGLRLGHCGVCGRTLTDQDSRARGIGPVCATKMGW